MARATSESAVSRTRLTFSRCRSPSGTSGNLPYSSSAITQPSTPSPRNSSRSLCGEPKLRCVSACASSAGSPKRWPRRRSSAGWRPTDAPPRGLLLGGCPEIDVDPDIGEQRNFLAIGGRNDDAAAVLGDLEIRALDRVDVVDGRPLVEILADFRNRGPGARLAGERVYRLLDGEEFDVGRQQLHADHRQHDEHRRAGHEAAQADAELLAAHVLVSLVHRNVPKRPSSPRFSQMKNALPTMFSSGTKPQTRLSLELSLLSPIIK